MGDRLIMRLRVVQAARETADVRTLALVHPRKPELPAWTAGAHVDVHLPEGGVRHYSLYGDPAERGLYRIAVKRESAGRGGSAFLHESVAEGDMLTVAAPRNHFPLNEAARRHVLIGAGIGVTPLSAMARALAAASADFELHYCARSPQDAPLLADLAQVCGARLHTYFSSEGRRLDLDGVLGREAGADLYVCGPARLTDAAERAAAAHDWPAERYHTERFTPRIDADFRPAPFAVRIASTGAELAVPADESLLAVLRAAGFETDSSCEIGVCGACECGYLDGEVIHRDVVLTPAARKTRLMACVSRARGTLTLDL